jgi:hypothetical protein
LTLIAGPASRDWRRQRPRDPHAPGGPMAEVVLIQLRRIFHAADERISKTSDCLAERVEFEPSGDATGWRADQATARPVPSRNPHATVSTTVRVRSKRPESRSCVRLTMGRSEKVHTFRSSFGRYRGIGRSRLAGERRVPAMLRVVSPLR